MGLHSTNLRITSIKNIQTSRQLKCPWIGSACTAVSAKKIDATSHKVQWTVTAENHNPRQVKCRALVGEVSRRQKWIPYGIRFSDKLNKWKFLLCSVHFTQSLKHFISGNCFLHYPGKFASFSLPLDARKGLSTKHSGGIISNFSSVF